MNFQKQLILFLLPLILFFSFYGCAGPTSAVIPDRIQPLSEEKARIVVTREKQIAGMTTPIYIVDIGEEIKTNATMKIRVGEWRKATTSHLHFINVHVLDKQVASGFIVAPVQGTTFAETDQTLDDLVSENVDAIVYVDYLRCDPARVDVEYCGNGKEECDISFNDQLAANKGFIIGDLSNSKSVEENSRGVRDVQVIGKFFGGDTLVWDRDPGIMRIGALWGSSNKSDHTLELTPVNLNVQPGETYYVHYTVNLGERWLIKNVEQ